MSQFAWLDLFDGKWLLLDGNLDSRARSWDDVDTALAQLKEEGWIITDPKPKKISVKSHRRQRIYGYAMTRTVH